MVADAHVVREGNLSRLVDITGKAGLPAALRTDGLAARPVFLKMESVSVHDALFCGFLQIKTAICSLQSLQSYRNSTFPSLRDCKTAKTAGCNKGSSVAVLGWRFIVIFIRFFRFIKYKLGRKTKVNQMKINMLYNKQLSYICIFSCFT